MAHFSRRLAFLATLISTTLVMVPEASAGPLLDWLFGRRNAAPVACGTCGPTQVQSSRPTTSYSVPTTQYVPAYRTVWQRVPVTNYRPNVQYDPTRGQNVTTLRPCADYEWQTRRVPVRSYRPVLGWLFGQSRTAPARPAYRVPTSTYSYSAPTSAYRNSAPADCNDGVSRTYAPREEYYAPRGESRLGDEDGWKDVAPGSGRYPDQPTLGRDEQVPETDYSGEGRTQAAPQSLRREQPAANKAPRAALNKPQGTRRPRPVLDPNPTFQTEQPSAPQLVRPRVKTAVARPQAGSFVLVSWPERGDSRVQRANLREPIPEPDRTPSRRIPQEDWEDDGFRPLK
jgi:hypothetical protein